MKCNQFRPGFELVSSCPIPTTITITPRVPLLVFTYRCIGIWNNMNEVLGTPYIYINIAQWFEDSPMVWETGVQCLVESHQRLKKWYLMRFLLIFSVIRHGSEVSGVILGKEWRPLIHLGVVAIEKGTLVWSAITVVQSTLAKELSAAPSVMQSSS